MPDEHSEISPSGFYRMIACPGSVAECRKAPFQEASIYAECGTIQHEAVTRRWKGRPISRLGLEPEELNNVDDCIDTLKEVIDGRRYTLTMEKRGDLSELGYPGIWGTCDIYLYILGNAGSIIEIHVIDWKFGSGVAVQVEDNPQTLGYLIMGMGKGYEGYLFALREKQIRAFHHIVQPPKRYHGVEEVNFEKLHRFSKLLMKAIEATTLPDAVLVPGEKQCKFCPAAMTCKGRYTHQLSMAHEVFAHLGSVKERPSAIVTPEQNAEIYTKLTELIAYHKELGNHGYAELMDDRPFPGYKLVEGRSTRSWKSEAVAIRWLAKYTSIKDFYAKPKFLSPAQMEKAERVLKKDTDFQQLITKPPGKAKMVAEDDKRETFNPNKQAEDVFADK